MGDRADAQFDHGNAQQLQEVREMIINETLNGICAECGKRSCNDDVFLEIPEDAVMIRAAFQDIARECRICCRPGWGCIKILRHSRTAVACDCDE